MRFLSIVKISLISILLFSCGTDTQPGNTGANNSVPAPADNQITVISSGNSPANDQSRISLRITDAPIDDAAKVVVTFLAVELKVDTPVFSKVFEFNSPKAIDLLTLQGTQTEDLLTNAAIEPGHYNEIRLAVDDSGMSSYIELKDGSVHPLKVPSGSASGLKLKGDIIIPSNRAGKFTLDFDVRRSIVRAGNSSNYLLKPVLRLLDDTSVGHIRGSVDPALLTDTSCSDTDVDTHNAVYVYAGADVIVDDINQLSETDVDPVSTATIKYDAQSDRYLFEAAFLEAGDYTIAITCNSNLEDIEADDELLFFNIQNVTVQVNDILFL